MGILRRALIFAVLSASAARVVDAQTDGTPPAEVPEYRLKAAFLYSFAKFVDWPEGSLGEPGDPITIGIYDPVPFKGFIKDLQDSKAKQRPVIVRYGRKAADFEGCHIVFLNAPDDLLIKALLRHFRNRPVLTVGERSGFARWGGVVNFRLREDRLRLEINRTAAERAGLRLSAQLLEVSDLVDGELP